MLPGTRLRAAGLVMLKTVCCSTFRAGGLLIETKCCRQESRSSADPQHTLSLVRKEVVLVPYQARDLSPSFTTDAGIRKSVLGYFHHFGSGVFF